MKIKILKIGHNSVWHGDDTALGAVIKVTKSQKQHSPHQIKAGTKPTRGGWWYYAEGTVVEAPSGKMSLGFHFAGSYLFCKRLV